MASVDAALSAERTAHARAIQNRDPSSRICTHSFTGTKNTALAQSAQLALELILDELEIEHASDTEDEPPNAEGKKLPRTARKREPFPKGLKRVQKTITPQ